jgi:hypothetical protein
MASQTMTYRRGGGISTLFIIIVICIILAMFTLPAMKESLHAELHAEAASIRAAYDAGCLAQRWVKLDLASGLQRDHCLVELPDGKVGDRIGNFCKNAGWMEVTCFIIGSGELCEAIEYLKKKGCAQVYP